MITAGSLVCRMMFFFALSTVIAASDHPTRAVYFAAITIFKAQAAVIEVTASSGGVYATEPTYQFSDLSGTPVATLTGNVSNGDITASGDLKASGVVEAADVRTTGGASMGDLAARLASAEAKIALLESICLSPPATPPPPPPPAIFSHLQEETYTGTADCDRGTIRSDATAAGLPTGTATYTVLLEFKCSGVPANAAFYSWGDNILDGANVLELHATTNLLRSNWWGNELWWLSSSDICDGAWHTTGAQFDGTTRRLFFDGATVASDTPSGSHADFNTNFCLGANSLHHEGSSASPFQPFTGSIRSFEVFTSGSIAATTIASP